MAAARRSLDHELIVHTDPLGTDFNLHLSESMYLSGTKVIRRLRFH